MLLPGVRHAARRETYNKRSACKLCWNLGAANLTVEMSSVVSGQTARPCLMQLQLNLLPEQGSWLPVQAAMLCRTNPSCPRTCRQWAPRQTSPRCSGLQPRYEVHQASCSRGARLASRTVHLQGSLQPVRCTAHGSPTDQQALHCNRFVPLAHTRLVDTAVLLLPCAVLSCCRGARGRSYRSTPEDLLHPLSHSSCCSSPCWGPAARLCMCVETPGGRWPTAGQWHQAPAQPTHVVGQHRCPLDSALSWRVGVGVGMR